MIQDDPPTTITGLLTGEDTKPLHAVHRCHFLWPHYAEIGNFVVGQQ